MIRRPPRSSRTDTLFPTRRSSDLIFISLSRGRYLDFPSTLEVPMESIGAMIARRAVAENRSIVSEVTATASEPLMALIDAMTSIGYRVNVIAIEKIGRAHV